MAFMTSQDIQAIIAGQMSHYAATAGVSAGITQAYGGYAPQVPQLPAPMVNDPRAPVVYGAVTQAASGGMAGQAGANLVGAGMHAAQFASGGLPMVGMAAGFKGMLGGTSSALRFLDPFEGAFAAGAAGMRGGGGIAGALGMGGLAMGAYMGVGAVANWGFNQGMQGIQQNQGLGSMLNIYGTRNQMPHMGGGGGISGPGQVGEIASAMRGLESANASFGDLTNLMQQGLQGGSFRGVQSIGQFKSKFKELVETTRTVAQALATSQQEALSMMDSMKDMGFTSTGASAGAALLTGQMAAGAGLSFGQMSGLGLQGAQLSRSIGGRGIEGAMASQQLATRIGAAVTSGAISRASLMDATGGLSGQAATQGLTDAWSRGAINMLGGSRGRVVLGAMLNPMTGEIDRDAASGFAAGAFTYKDLLKRYRSNMSHTGMAQNLRANRGELTSQLLEAAGPEALISEYAGMRASQHGQSGNPNIDKILMQQFTGMANPEIELLRKIRAGAGEFKQMAKTSWERSLEETSKAAFARSNLTWEGIKAQLKAKFVAPVSEAIRDTFGQLSSDAAQWMQETVNDWAGIRTTSVSGRFDRASQLMAMGDKSGANREMGIFPDQAAQGFGGYQGGGLSGGVTGGVAGGIPSMYGAGLALRGGGAALRGVGGFVGRGAGWKYGGRILGHAAAGLGRAGAGASLAGSLAGRAAAGLMSGPVGIAVATGSLIADSPSLLDHIYGGYKDQVSMTEDQAESFWSLHESGFSKGMDARLIRNNRAADLRTGRTSGPANYVAAPKNIQGGDGLGWINRAFREHVSSADSAMGVSRDSLQMLSERAIEMEFSPGSVTKRWGEHEQTILKSLRGNTSLWADVAATRASGGYRDASPSERFGMLRGLTSQAMRDEATRARSPGARAAFEGVANSPGGGMAGLSFISRGAGVRGLAKEVSGFAVDPESFEEKLSSKALARKAIQSMREHGGLELGEDHEISYFGQKTTWTEGVDLRGAEDTLAAMWDGDKKHAALQKVLYNAQVSARNSRDGETIGRKEKDQLAAMGRRYVGEEAGTAAWVLRMAQTGKIDKETAGFLARGGQRSYVNDSKAYAERWGKKLDAHVVERGSRGFRDLNSALGPGGMEDFSLYISSRASDGFAGTEAAEDAGNRVANLIADRYGDDPDQLGIIARYAGQVTGGEVLSRGIRRAGVEKLLYSKNKRKGRAGILGLMKGTRGYGELGDHFNELVRGNIAGMGGGDVLASIEESYYGMGMSWETASTMAGHTLEYLKDPASLAPEDAEALAQALSVAQSPGGGVSGTRADGEMINDAFWNRMESLTAQIGELLDKE